MLNDTEVRKRIALELLALGRSKRQICAEMGIKPVKIRQWKDQDERFRNAWNGMMAEAGRWIEGETE